MVQPNSCVTMISDALRLRSYDSYAETASGRSWGGSCNFCVQDEKFDIVGADDCESRGYDTVGFSEHDVGGRTDHTVLFGP